MKAAGIYNNLIHGYHNPGRQCYGNAFDHRESSPALGVISPLSFVVEASEIKSVWYLYRGSFDADIPLEPLL